MMLKPLQALPSCGPIPSFAAARRACMCKMSSAPPPSPPSSPACPKFVSVEGSDFYSRSKPDGFRFRLVSYNILAQAYVKSSLFPHSPSPCLSFTLMHNAGKSDMSINFGDVLFSDLKLWKTRSQAILTVLKNLEADFLCLQEVDEYDTFYKANMETHGYSSIYIKRNGKKRDGCSIFYKPDSAELVLDEKIEYNDLVNSVLDGTLSNDDTQHNTVAVALQEAELKSVSAPETAPEGRGDPNDPRVRLKRDCVGIMAAFRLRDPSHKLVIVANTHIYWDPEWADVKLAQAKYLLARLAQFKTVVSEHFECVPSIIVAGDFNSTPGDKVYQYLVSGNSSSVPPECTEELPIPLSSVYALTRGEPPFTNCTPDFTDTLDYIFFSPSCNVKPVSLLELPEPESSGILGGLPNYHHPSDHLPIGAEFELVEA